MPTKVAESAGGVVVRRVDTGLEVLLVGSTTTWGLPKGTPSAGEERTQTAQREVEEETGLEVEVLEPIGSIRYWFVANGRRVRKTVYYYLMRAMGGDTSRHDWENERIGWFPLEEALRVMTYPNEKEMVRQAGELADKWV
ncbi:MAG: NUDIX hydrolase [Chloroflexi bacterium]|nr:NUDIX hydrolase [Chloroflexota bacterium]